MQCNATEGVKFPDEKRYKGVGLYNTVQRNVKKTSEIKFSGSWSHSELFLGKSSQKAVRHYDLHRCQPSHNRVGNSAFFLPFHIPAFLRKRPAFFALFHKKSNSLEIADFPLHVDIFWTISCAKMHAARSSNVFDT